MVRTALDWLATPEGFTAAAGFLLAAISVTLRYLPDTPLVVALRSWFVDYAHRNVHVLPGSLSARLEYDSEPGAVVVLSVGDKEVKRLRVPL